MTGATKSQQFKYVEASITSDRVGGFDAGFLDVRTSVAELNLFESLDKAYLTGNITILDDKAIFDTMSFQGTERIKIVLASTDENLDPVFERTFIMTGIERQQKANANAKSSLYVFTLIDEHAYHSRAKKISKSFKGSLQRIIQKILGGELKKDIDISYLLDGRGQEVRPVQTNIKGVIPNLQPLEAVKWFTERATTQTGSPFFVYASMHDDNIRIGNLDVMLSQKAFNRKLPYTYNPSNVSVAEGQTELEKTFSIKAIKLAKLANSLQLVESGNVGASYSNTNLNTGQIFSQPFSIRKTLQRLREENIIGNNQNVFDGDFVVGDTQIDLLESRRYHTVTSSGTYGTRKSYHDEFNENKFRKKLESRSLKYHLYKNMLNIVVDGAGFIVSKASVGDIVNLEIVNDNTEVQRGSSKDDLLDKRFSGNHIIYDTRHTFSGTNHVVAMNVCKLEKLP